MKHLKENIISHPFIEEKSGDFYNRTFLSSLNENELKWHFDEQDRIVTCEEETDWLFQLDNQLPVKIEKNKSIFIPEGEYHRIIKGTNDLTLKIKKLY